MGSLVQSKVDRKIYSRKWWNCHRQVAIDKCQKVPGVPRTERGDLHRSCLFNILLTLFSMTLSKAYALWNLLSQPFMPSMVFARTVSNVMKCV